MRTKSVLLIGLGRFGKYIAMKLHELGHEVMAVDESEDRINDVMPYVTNGQIGDSTNEALLKSLEAKFLLRNGADEIIYPEKQLAVWAAIRYSSDHVLDYIELGDSCSIFEVEVPQAWRGKSVAEIDIRKKYNVNIIATKKNGKIDAVVSAETVLSEDETLLVLGEYKAVQKCFAI